MQSHAKRIFIKLNLSVIGILLFVSPCYPENAPNASPDDPALVIQRALRSALESADEVILYSLDPTDLIVLPGGTPPSPEYLATLFNRYGILGQARIDAPSERRALVDGLCQGLANHPSEIELCFCPHHSLRLRKGSQKLDVTICFQCHQIQPNGDSPFFPISSSPQAIFDSAVKKAHFASFDQEDTLRLNHLPRAAARAKEIARSQAGVVS